MPAAAVSCRQISDDAVAILIVVDFFPICVGVTVNVATDLFSGVVEYDENDNSVLFFGLCGDELICDIADAVEPFEWNEDKIDCVFGDE